MPTLQEMIVRHDVEVLDHLDREAEVPVLNGMQRQGDVIVIPTSAELAGDPVPSDGIAVVRGDNGGNTHLLLGEGEITFRTRTDAEHEMTLGLLTVPYGSVAWLAHPEHGFLGIAPGNYELRRQREAEITPKSEARQQPNFRLVAD